LSIENFLFVIEDRPAGGFVVAGGERRVRRFS
jgi:hypothetical protein